MAGNRITVYGAMAANAGIAATKFAAAAITGSSAMLSEAIHSAVDTINEVLLLVGVRRSDRPADAQHPFGHGRELYFWTLIVAVGLFGVGGGMSIYEGIAHILQPEPLQDPKWNYAVLVVAFLFEGTSLVIALHALGKERRPGVGLLPAWRRSKDPSVFTVVGEDSAAIAGVLLAAAGVFLSHRLEMPWIDGAASIGIGLVLTTVALFLAFETRGLLVGEAARVEVRQAIREAVEKERDVELCREPLTMQLGPDEVLLNMELSFRPDLPAGEVAATLDRVGQAIQREHPQVTRIFVDVQAR
jgi:cation diffusion facilitator family transporter